MNSTAIIILGKIFFAQSVGSPIGFGDVWITSRGNSWCIIREELIPKKLVCEKNNCFFVTDLGRKVITLVFKIDSLKIKLQKTLKIEEKEVIKGDIQKCSSELKLLTSDKEELL